MHPLFDIVAFCFILCIFMGKLHVGVYYFVLCENRHININAILNHLLYLCLFAKSLAHF